MNRLYIDQRFTLVLLNRGGNIITVFFKPLFGPEEAFEVPPSTPGVILDNLPYEKLAGGIEAIAAVGVTNLQVNMYSNDISWFRPAEGEGLFEDYPRDTFKYGEIQKEATP